MVHSQDGDKVVLLQSGGGAGGASKLGPLRPKYKGVRLRSWGKWVSEIRIPNTRHKIWLGSYPSAHQAARAYDMAAVCLRGISSSNALNFPDSPPPQISTPGSLSPRSIQAVAAARASSPPVVSCSPSSGAGTPPLEKQEEESNMTITPPTSPHSSSDIPDIQATQSCGFLCLDCPHVSEPQGGMGCLDEDMSYFLDLEPLGFIPTSSLVTTYHAFQFDNGPSVDFQLWA